MKILALLSELVFEVVGTSKMKEFKWLESFQSCENLKVYLIGLKISDFLINEFCKVKNI